MWIFLERESPTVVSLLMYSSLRCILNPAVGFLPLSSHWNCSSRKSTSRLQDSIWLLRRIPRGWSPLLLETLHSFTFLPSHSPCFFSQLLATPLSPLLAPLLFQHLNIHASGCVSKPLSLLSLHLLFGDLIQLHGFQTIVCQWQQASSIWTWPLSIHMVFPHQCRISFSNKMEPTSTPGSSISLNDTNYSS